MNTEIGKIAHALESKATRTETGWKKVWHKCKVLLGVAETTPLQIKLNKLAYFLLGWSIIIAIIVVASTGFPGTIPLTVATYAVAAAVSILPASLIAVVSLTLARASQDLAKRNALVRRMDAIEALAGVENVCSDKTGTLTVGKMTVRKFWVPAADDREGESAPLNTENGQAYSFKTGSEPFYPRGEVHADTRILQMEDDGVLDLKSTKPARRTTEDDIDDEISAQNTLVHVEKMEQNLRNMVLCASLCNQATLHKGEEGWEANGDPTEIALQVSAHKLGHGKPFLTHQSKQHHEKIPLNRTASRSSGKPIVAGMNGHYEQLVEHPFDSGVKRMSIAYKFVPDEGSSDKAHVVCFLKGAVERVMDRVVSIVGEDFDDNRKEEIIRKMDTLAAQGLRVLGFSGKFLPVDEAESVKTMERDAFEKGFSFLGLAGIYDPPRKESAGAVADCLRAGITPRMLTGDHPATATAIALSIGILEKTYGKEMVMTGQQFDALSNEQIDAMPELPLVVARCAPETKVRMVDAIHRRGEHTVMTGDGVNDSPALKRADVGVGMGTGSDVAKQSSNLVLADDNFATICRAIRKGRSVFRNLSKFLLYLLSGNLAEIIVLMIGLAFKDSNGQSVFPLSPVAALWINTLAAGPPALALGLEPTADDAMEQAPSAFQTIFNLEFYIDLTFYGFLIGALSIVNFVIVLWGYFPGNLGEYCNEGFSASCDPVFQARSTCYSTLVIILMIHSLQCKHFSRGIFQVNLLDNKVLLWCALVLMLTTFPIVYIPVINDKVFLIGSLGWEWGIVFGMILVYLASSELYKWCKRIYLRRKGLAPRKRAAPSDKTLRLEPTMRA